MENRWTRSFFHRNHRQHTMSHDSAIGGLWNGSASSRKHKIIFGFALLLVFALIMIGHQRSPIKDESNNNTNNEQNKNNEPTFTVAQCPIYTRAFKIKPGPVLDSFMNSDSEDKCTQVLEEDQESLEATRKCRQDPLNFFLFWSTKREDFALRHFRVIDSIFKYHPNARLHIFTKEMSINDFSFYTTRSFKVVHHKLEPEKLFKDTPLARWASNIEEWKKSSNYFSHVTDALRLAVLWKYGGVYLDTDAIVMRNLDSVRNALGVQHPSSVATGEVNGAVMIFDKRHPFLFFAMHLLMSIYDPNNWDIAGPQVVTRAVASWSNLHPYMVRWIPEHSADEFELPNEPVGTPEVTVFTDRFAFYGLAWWQLPRVDMTEDHADLESFKRDLEKKAYAYHYVNQMVRKTGKRIKKGFYLFDLLQRACLFECSYEDLDISITEVMDGTRN